MSLRRSPSLRALRGAFLQIQHLEERWTPTWGATPPATIPNPPSPATITFDAQVHSAGSASIDRKEIDYYKFTASTDGLYRFSTATPSSNLDTVMGLYSSARKRLAYNDDISSSNSDSTFTFNLVAGTQYFVGITNWTRSENGAYNWSIDGPVPTPPVVDDTYENNDTQATASDLGTLTGPMTITNLMVSDAHDYYKFVMPARGSATNYLQLNFLHSQGDLDIELLRANGTRVARSQGVGNSERISLNNLVGGTYYVHVYGYLGVKNPNYSLTIDGAGPPANPTIDLSGASLLSSETAIWGQAVTVTGTVLNSGNILSGNFAVRWYLSQDAAGSADDIPLTAIGNPGGVVTVTGVPGTVASDPFSAALQLPATIPAGWTGSTFYVVMQVDANSQITESNEANNFGTVGVGFDAVAVTIDVAPPPGGFRIQLNITGMTATQTAIFQQAAARWERAILGDLPNANYNGTVVDDLLIDASGEAIDGRGGVLGQAGPDRFRSGSYLPYHGIMEFDTADLTSMERDGSLLYVIIHEMGHVLGVGTIWDDRGLLSGAGTSNPRFTGPQATAAYNAIYGRNDAGVPVENTGGGGTRDSHWRENIFTNELMTGWIGPGLPLPMSRVTVASLADLGYQVNLAAADNFTPTAAGRAQANSAANNQNVRSLQAAATADLWFAEFFRQQGKKESTIF